MIPDKRGIVGSLRIAGFVHGGGSGHDPLPAVQQEAIPVGICPLLSGWFSLFEGAHLEEGQAELSAAGLTVELCRFADGGRPAAAPADHLDRVGGAVRSLLKYPSIS